MDDSAPDGSKRHVNERIDVRVGVERRRRWGRENKLSIVRESLAPNAVVTEVARRHEIFSTHIWGEFTNSPPNDNLLLQAGCGAACPWISWRSGKVNPSARWPSSPVSLC